MVKHRKQPGPHEFLAGESSAEIEHGDSPDGTMPGVEPVFQPFHFARDFGTLAQIEREDAPLGGGEKVRRTSLDRDALRPVGPVNRPAEERVDGSTGDGQRENALDPAQDESGPQSDQA